MTVGKGILGRQCVLEIAGQEILGITTKGITVTNESVDVTDDDSTGWTEVLATPGVRALELPFSGFVKNLELLRSILTNEDSQMYPFTLTYLDKSVVAGNGFLTSYTDTGESGTAYTFDCSLQISGKPTFTAGAGS